MTKTSPNGSWPRRTLAILTYVATGALAFATTTAAQQSNVTLQSADGAIDVTGGLIAFEDGAYHLQTQFGPLSVPETGVTCIGLACPQMGPKAPRVSIAGSSALTQELMPLLVGGYAATLDASVDPINGSGLKGMHVQLVGQQGFGDPVKEVLVQEVSNPAGFSSLLSKTADIAASSRRILRDEAMALRENGAASMVSIKSEHVVAIDSLAVITHPDNPVQSLSTRDLAKIYSSEITNWAQLGGPDAPINVYARGQGSGARFEFDKEIMGEPGSTLRAPSLNFPGDGLAMASAVRSDPYGIGYVSYATLRGTKPLSLVNECGLTLEPGPFASKTEEYPLSRRLYLYSRQDNLSPEAAGVVNFAISPSADAVIEKTGYFSLRVESAELDNTRAHLAAMAANETETFLLNEIDRMQSEMEGWQRLSTMFRFGTGALRIDNKGLRDVERLVSHLQDQQVPVEVAFVGFTDDSGVFESNTDLSLMRAEETAKQIQGLIETPLQNVTFTSKGFGELAPVGCNQSTQGRAINRRVEVWIRQAI